LKNATWKPFCSVTLAIAMLLYGPGIVKADNAVTQPESTQTADGDKQQQQEQAANQQEKQEKRDSSAAAASSGANVPVTEVEVTADKQKNKLTIGQQPDAEGVKDYVITQSSTGSKSNMNNKDLPQSIASVGQKIMADQNSLTASDALANIAGVQAQTKPSYFDVYNAYTIRGFNATYNYVDGLWDQCTTNNGWIGNIDRIEVLKGPASVLYGNGTAGGIINYVTKKPLPYEAFTYGVEYGSWGTKSVNVDISVPLTEDKKWLSRTIIEKTDYATFQKNSDDFKRFNGSFIVQGKPRDETTYTFTAQFNDYKNSPPSYLPLTGTIKAPYGLVPYDASYNDPSAETHTIGRALSARVDHKLNDVWTVSTGLRYSTYTYDANLKYGSGLNVNTANPALSTVNMYYQSFYRQNTAWVWDTTANAKFKTGDLNHDLTTGFTWAHFTQDQPRGIMGRRAYATVNVLDPIFPEYTISGTSWGRHTHEYRYGSYLSDVIELSPKLKLSAGVSLTKQTSGVADSYASKESGTAKRFGATYETSPGVTWFAGYSTYYAPQVPQDDGYQYVYFKPETGNQVEGGVKVDISKRASLTFSVYRIDRENISYGTEDPSDANHTIYDLIGKQRSKGFDLDASYVIQPGWNLLATYSHCNAKVLEDDTFAAGSVVPNVPQNSFKLWTTYEYLDGPRKGLGFGGGLTFVGKRTVAYDNTIGWMDGYKTLDAVVYYKIKNTRYSLNAYNLTNKKYWATSYYSTSGTGSSGVYAGTPRSFILRIEQSF